MTFFKSSFTLRTSTLLPTILDDIEVFKMGFACFCCCPFCPPIFPQGSGFGEVCLAMAGSILCLSDYHAANPARQLAMMSLTRPWHPLMDGASHFKHIHTEKSTLLRLQLKGLILKSASQPCCCQANSEEKRNIAQCSKTTRMYGPSSPKQVASSHVFFSFFSTMYQKHLQTWQRLQTTEQKIYIKTTWKTQQKCHQVSVTALSKFVCSASMLCGMIASGQETFQNFSLKATNKHTQHHIPSLKLTYSSTWKYAETQ